MGAGGWAGGEGGDPTRGEYVLVLFPLFYFDTHYLIIARLAAVQGAESVRVVIFPSRREEGEEEEVALAERGQVAAMWRGRRENG